MSECVRACVKEAAAEEEAVPRRDPSAKQEPHTVMWGIIFYFIIKIYFYNIRRPGQTQGGAREGIRHLTLVSD